MTEAWEDVVSGVSQGDIPQPTGRTVEQRGFHLDQMTRRR